MNSLIKVILFKWDAGSQSWGVNDEIVLSPYFVDILEVFFLNFRHRFGLTVITINHLSVFTSVYFYLFFGAFIIELRDKFVNHCFWGTTWDNFLILINRVNNGINVLLFLLFSWSNFIQLNSVFFLIFVSIVNDLEVLSLGELGD